MIGQIDIRPSTGVYGTYKRLSYKAWFAAAEFVDNSTQSYYDHKEELNNQEYFRKLYININYNRDEDYLEITDNAYGMDFEDFKRALILDKPPKNVNGRNEFGMGLKTAACWFGNLWSVETTSLGSNKLFSATVDVEDLQINKTSNIEYSISDSNELEHYTKIVIRKLNQNMFGKTLTRIKDQLSSIYRNDIRQGEIEIILNGETLTYEEPTILEEELENQEVKKWKKDIEIEIVGSNGKLYYVNGWIALRDPASTSNAGFTLMRRGRVIIGGPGENYRPVEIFGKPNSFEYQRLFGELNLDNWEVTQAKDGFDWNNGLEDELINKLLYNCKDYIFKAQTYRKNESKKVEDITQQEKENIIQETVSGLNNALHELEEEPIRHSNDTSEPIQSVLEIPDDKAKEMFSYKIDDYIITVKWYSDNELGAWMTTKEFDNGCIEISLNTRHAFFVPFINNIEFLTLINKFACAMIIAEKYARKTSDRGYVEASEIRNYMNKLLDKMARM